MHIKLMTEYECWPIWEIVDGPSVNLPISELAIAPSLKLAIEKWDKRFQSTYDSINPTESGFQNRAEAKIFQAEGIELAKQLQMNLGEDSIVEYVDVSV